MEKFNCPYCNNQIETGDFHAHEIKRKNLKDKTTIIVQCILNRTFEITLKQLNGEK